MSQKEYLLIIHCALWIRLRRIIHEITTVPLCRPTVAVVALFASLSEWNNFIWPLTVGDISKGRRLAFVGVVHDVGIQPLALHHALLKNSRLNRLQAAGLLSAVREPAPQTPDLLSVSCTKPPLLHHQSFVWQLYWRLALPSHRLRSQPLHRWCWATMPRQTADRLVMLWHR